MAGPVRCRVVGEPLLRVGALGEVGADRGFVNLMARLPQHAGTRADPLQSFLAPLSELEHRIKPQTVPVRDTVGRRHGGRHLGGVSGLGRTPLASRAAVCRTQVLRLRFCKVAFQDQQL
jgi:hypothetical protein